jgi:hypothetical protein
MDEWTTHELLWIEFHGWMTKVSWMKSRNEYKFIHEIWSKFIFYLQKFIQISFMKVCDSLPSLIFMLVMLILNADVPSHDVCWRST